MSNIWFLSLPIWKEKNGKVLWAISAPKREILLLRYSSPCRKRTYFWMLWAIHSILTGFTMMVHEKIYLEAKNNNISLSEIIFTDHVRCTKEGNAVSLVWLSTERVPIPLGRDHRKDWERMTVGIPPSWRLSWAQLYFIRWSLTMLDFFVRMVFTDFPTGSGS